MQTKQKEKRPLQCQRWEFKDMAVGDVLIFDPNLYGGELARKAQVYCHTYGSKCNKSFRTERTDEGLTIERVY